MTTSTQVTLRADDREILAVLENGPLSANEIADRIRQRAFDRWSDRHGYDFEWGTDARGTEEPLGARLLALGEAKDEGIKTLGYQLHPRLRALEKRGAVERIQIEGQRPMLWRSRV